MKYPFPLPRAELRKLFRGIFQGEIKIGPLKYDFRPTEPFETRGGTDPNDRSPFYTENFSHLYSWYHAYEGSNEFHNWLLYTDVSAIAPIGLLGFERNALDERSIEFDCFSAPWRCPVSLLKHREAAVQLFKCLQPEPKLRRNPDGRWLNNRALRIDSVEKSFIQCRPAFYFDQVGTNLTLDWRSGALDRGFTIRATVERPVDGLLPSLLDSSLANTLGVAVVLYDRDMVRAIMRTRSRDLGAITSGGVHCTASGVYRPAPDIEGSQFGIDRIVDGMYAEISSEIGLSRDECDLFPIALARELPRGGKPQIFFVARSLVASSTLHRKMENANESWEFLDTGLGSLAQTVSLGDGPSAFTYEGWAALLMAERFIEANGVERLIATAARN